MRILLTKSACDGDRNTAGSVQKDRMNSIQRIISGSVMEGGRAFVTTVIESMEVDLLPTRKQIGAVSLGRTATITRGGWALCITQSPLVARSVELVGFVVPTIK